MHNFFREELDGRAKINILECLIHWSSGNPTFLKKFLDFKQESRKVKLKYYCQVEIKT